MQFISKWTMGDSNNLLFTCSRMYWLIDFALKNNALHNVMCLICETCSVGKGQPCFSQLLQTMYYLDTN